MAINQINSVGRKESESALDKIAKGLQIAQSVFGIYSGYQTGRKAGIDADVASDAREGVFDPATVTKMGNRYRLTPKSEQATIPLPAGRAQDEMTSLMPTQAAGMVPPQERFSKLPRVPFKLRQGGETVDAEMWSGTDEDKAESEETRLRGEFQGRDPVKIEEQAAQNYSIIRDLLTKNDNKADTIAISNTMRLFNPNVGRNAHGDFDNGDGVPENLKKWFNKITGNPNTVLLPGERREILAFAGQRMKSAIDLADPTRKEFTSYADQKGLLKENLGMKDYRSLIPEGEESPQPAAKTGKTANKKPPTDKELALQEIARRKAQNAKR